MFDRDINEVALQYNIESRYGLIISGYKYNDEPFLLVKTRNINESRAINGIHPFQIQMELERFARLANNFDNGVDNISFFRLYINHQCKMETVLTNTATPDGRLDINQMTENTQLNNIFTRMPHYGRNGTFFKRLFHDTALGGEFRYNRNTYQKLHREEVLHLLENNEFNYCDD